MASRPVLQLTNTDTAEYNEDVIINDMDITGAISVGGVVPTANQYIGTDSLNTFGWHSSIFSNMIHVCKFEIASGQNLNAALNVYPTVTTPAIYNNANMNITWSAVGPSSTFTLPVNQVFLVEAQFKFASTSASSFYIYAETVPSANLPDESIVEPTTIETHLSFIMDTTGGNDNRINWYTDRISTYATAKTTGNICYIQFTRIQ